MRVPCWIHWGLTGAEQDPQGGGDGNGVCSLGASCPSLCFPRPPPWFKAGDVAFLEISNIFSKNLIPFFSPTKMESDF